MKLSFVLTAATIYSMASALVHYHTEYHYVTVDANGNYVGGDKPASSASVATDDSGAAAVKLAATVAASNNVQVAATTAVTTRSSTAAAAAATTASSAASGSSNSGSGIYAEIDSSGADASFAKEILDAHNAKRALHSADKLSWDTEVYKYAQAYADQYTCGSGLVHSGGKYGENLALGYNSGTAALDGWYNEVKGYDYSSNAYNHFTQVVWKGTTKLGCAYKKCSDGWYVICSYDPAGNVVGQFSSNVLAS